MTFFKNKLVRVIFAIILVGIAATSIYAATKLRSNNSIVKVGQLNSTSLTDDLFVWYTMDDSDIGGFGLTDRSGNNRTALEYGSFASHDGVLGNATHFNGSDHLEISNSILHRNAFTASLWFKADDIHAGVNPRLLANSHTDSEGSPMGFQLAYEDGGATGFFDVGNTFVEGTAYWHYQLASSTWYHYVGVYDGTHVYAYINGIEVASSSFSGIMIAPNQNIGVGYNPAYDGDHFTGDIDDVRIYNYALSSDAVRALYEKKSRYITSSSTAVINDSQNSFFNNGLVRLWSFDGQRMSWRTSVEGYALDSSGNYATATLISFNQQNAPIIGKAGQALHLIGYQYLQTTRPVQDDMTICAWFRTTASGLNNDHWDTMPIFDVEKPGLDNDFGFGVGANGRLIFGDGDISTQDYTFQTNTIVNTGKWTHGCATRKKDTGRIELYVNGQIDGEGDGSETSLTGQSIALIGHGSDEGEWQETYWRGDLDELRIYDRVLSPAEIHTLYEGTK